MKNRIYAILNGRQELSTVVRNLKQLFTDDCGVLLYTKSPLSEVQSVFESEGIVGEGQFGDMVSYTKFNEYKAEDFRDGKAAKYTVIRMPQSLFKTVPHALNHMMEFATSTGIARFVHFFFDDLKVADGKTYRPDGYEWYMDMFDEPFILDAKLNRANYAFNKLSPRFIFASKLLKSPVSFYQFEGRDHFIIDVTKFSARFDEHIKRLYMVEYVARAHANGIVKHPTFYPDPVLEATVVRDPALAQTPSTEEVMKEFHADDQYIRGTLKVALRAETSIDPIIDYMSAVIERKGVDGSAGTAATEPKGDAPEVVVPEVVQ